MGFYINHNSKGEALRPRGKVIALITDGAKVIDPPKEWRPGLVCVVMNGPFDAAAYAFDEREMDEFLVVDGRPTQWLEYPHAEELSGYVHQVNANT